MMEVLVVIVVLLHLEVALWSVSRHERSTSLVRPVLA